MRHVCIIDVAMSLAEGSANKHLCSMQFYVNKVHFLKLLRVVLNMFYLKLNSANDWWLQSCKLGNEWAWVNKIDMIGYIWLFVYENPRTYQGRMNAGP